MEKSDSTNSQSYKFITTLISLDDKIFGEFKSLDHKDKEEHESADQLRFSFKFCFLSFKKPLEHQLQRLLNLEDI